MIRLTRAGTEFAGRPTDIDRLRRQFKRDHCVRLPRLLERGLLQQVLDRIERASVLPRAHECIGEELCLDDPVTISLLTFLANDPRFLRIVQQITECGLIGCWSGRVYRMLPRSGHYDSWHDDLGDHRLVAMSLNLSPKIYSGGVLRIRQHATGQIVYTVANTGLGDAVLFRLSPELDHHVTEVEGSVPKTAFAGWFKSRPAFHAWVLEHAAATHTSSAGQSV